MIKKLGCSYKIIEKSIKLWANINKVLRVIQLKQSALLKENIIENITLRAKAKCDFK